MSKQANDEKLSAQEFKEQMLKILQQRVSVGGRTNRMETSMEEVFQQMRAQKLQDSLLQSPKYTKNFIIMGAPGSGKGTLARVLKERFGVLGIATGDALRAHREARTKIGVEIGKLLSSGSLVPDRIVNEIVRTEVLNICQSAAGFILDGYPRNVPQMNYFHRKAGALVSGVIYLKITTQQAQERMLNRRVCKHCNVSYNYGFNLAEGVTKCPTCDAMLEFREDDSDPKIIEKRINIFETETQPILQFYQQQGLLVTFDATLNPEKIADAIQERFFFQLKNKTPEELFFWDKTTQEKFLWSMVRLSDPEFNYGVNKQKYKSEFDRLRAYYPWPVEGKNKKSLNLQAGFTKFLDKHEGRIPPVLTNEKILSNTERAMREAVLQRLIQERNEEQNSPVFSGYDSEEDFNSLTMDEPNEIVEDKEEE